ncbi:uncharacterized protein LOC100836466 [Brachypodium distachyon]|nr:uncharacterized protein LOC100836466 [Brachypodium distachyon]|eukprot:XP_003571492.2 uncharacterized protein LOC100836466 [Brachypodium distachyon]
MGLDRAGPVWGYMGRFDDYGIIRSGGRGEESDISTGRRNSESTMSGGRKPAGEEAEVEALLRAAQDAVLLKLQANSHLVSSSTASNLPPPLDSAPGALDDDLARRFEALKTRPPVPAKQPAAGMDEAEARFAALKGAPAAVGPERVWLEDLGDGESEDEVEKVMRWAMDAARLDVATAGTGGATTGDGRTEGKEEEQEDDKSSVSSSEEEEEEERLELEMEKKRKEMMSKNKSKNRWFFF